MSILIGFFNLAGSLVCHQLPARTISTGGIPLPLCARDTGIYLGVFTGLVFILASGRFRSDKPPRVMLSAILCLCMLPMVLDGIGSYTGLIGTSNAQRLFTGGLFGTAIPFFLIPAANFSISSPNRKAVLKKPAELFIAMAASAVLCAAVLEGNIIPYIVVSMVILSSMIFLIARIAYTVVVRAKPFIRYRMLASAGVTLCILLFLYMVSTLILQPLKAVFLR